MYAESISRILLRRQHAANLCAAFTARPATLLKLIDRLYLSLDCCFLLLVSCKLPFPVVGIKISSLRNFTLICPNRIHNEHMQIQLLFKNYANISKLIFEVLSVMSWSNILLFLCYSKVSGSRFIPFMLLQ
jgi:hypothetical protein